MQAACGLITPVSVLSSGQRKPAAAASSWLAHVDRKNVIATSWTPLAGGEGLRVRLLETEGRGGRFRLSTFRPPASARQIDFRGEKLTDLTIEDGAVMVNLAARELAEVEVRFEG